MKPQHNWGENLFEVEFSVQLECFLKEVPKISSVVFLSSSKCVGLWNPKICTLTRNFLNSIHVFSRDLSKVRYGQVAKFTTTTIMFICIQQLPNKQSHFGNRAG